MLINPSYVLKYVQPTQEGRPYIGTVVSNEDPKGFGRVKVQVKGMLEGNIADLPWARLQSQVGLGGGPFSVWMIPNVGSEVQVSFVYGIYNPLIIGVAMSEKTKIPGFDGIPSRYGMRDEQGTIFVVDRATGSLKLHHGPSGNEFSWDASGNEVKIIKGSSMTRVVGDHTVESGGKNVFKGTKTVLDSPTTDLTGNLNMV